MRVMWVVAVLASVVVAGCSAPTACDVEECKLAASPLPTEITWPLDTGFPPTPVDEALRSLRIQECTGIGGILVVPFTSVAPHVPPEFQAFAYGPGTGQLGFLALECQRSVFLNSVGPPLRILYAGIDVLVRDGSWEPEPVPSRLHVAFYASDPKVAEHLDSLGIAAAEAAIEIVRGPDATSPVVWSLDADDLLLAFSYRAGPGDGECSNGTNYGWIGTGPYQRIDWQVEYDASDIGLWAGPAVAAGNGRLAEILGPAPVPWVANPTGKESWHLSLVPQLFGD